MYNQTDRSNLNIPLIVDHEGWHAGSVTAVAVSPDGRWAVSGSGDKTLTVVEQLRHRYDYLSAQLALEGMANLQSTEPSSDYLMDLTDV